jgi:GT2 family glycosyltransferase
VSFPRPLSVIVPVRDGAATLTRALTAILASDLNRDEFELIVVDDDSSDGSPELAARFADVVIRLTSRSSGPAYARNRGAELATGEMLAFVDQDAMVQPDTLSGMLTMLSDDPELDAVSASYKRSAVPQNLVSQYWNLLRVFGEQRRNARGADVASPCTIIRHAIFDTAGMYDEWRFGRTPLEGIELGNRLNSSGRALVTARNLEVAGLKRWTMRSLCDQVWNRSLLLARSLGYQRTRNTLPSEVVFTLSRSGGPILAVISIVALSAAFVPSPSVIKTTVAFLLAAISLNLPTLIFFGRTRGLAFALSVAPLHFLAQTINSLGLCAGWLLRDAIGDREPDAATRAYAEVGLETWPPVPRAFGR